ncbi:MAG TPA: hypothetical protein IAA21_05570 [Candidatus Blautia faecigallinarum]|uniref:Uncharacterized protein n=1 Tax=Candidatus Blautia faecigallinarum TaxID=2838488 RepID=A0A9D2DS74_9FIRM|nr:hypothetical protein [Candidatus Blautia faecigallinarum]
MIIFADCQDIRKMAVIKEIDCPKCGAKNGIEVFERDSQTIGDSVCDQCEFTIPEGVVLEVYLDGLYEKDKKV